MPSTLAAAEAGELVRVALDAGLSLDRVLRAVGDEPLPFALVGAWAGGGAIVGSDPVRVAADGADPFATLDDLPPAPAGAPAAAVGSGWFGWLGYRLAARVERVPLAPVRPVPLPDFHLAYYDNVVRRDGDGRWWFEALPGPGRRGELEARLRRLRRRLAEGGGPATRPGPFDRPAGPAGPAGPALRLAGAAAAHHLDAVAQCRRRIAAGEIFQANICLRLEGAAPGRPIELLPGAVARTAAPYAAAFDTRRGGLVSLSPELFLRRRGRDMVTGPIKGTIVRDPDPVRAEAALAELRGSVKDAAEHVMIVDLMRNDLGRVCEYGSVRAPRRPTVEPHPGLWHLVSQVRGRLRPGVGDGELLRAAFPPGSVTGAPKVQSLRVIAELEPVGREVYTGAIGFASPLAGLELNVAIRTLELAAGRAWLGAGGGIVADSEPRAELAEALNKARPIAAALGMALAAEAPGVPAPA